MQGAERSARGAGARRRIPCALRTALCALILAACATTPKPPPLAAPAWDAIPAGVLDVLCTRLKMDAIASGAPLALVATTRPLATSETMAALARSGRGRTPQARVATSTEEANRAIPIMTAGSSCGWRPIAESQLDTVRDEMLVELSAPLLHPFLPKQAGLFARAAVDGQGASWYWITLVPQGDGWRVVSVTVLVQ
jgi:hypothetical protein